MRTRSEERVLRAEMMKTAETRDKVGRASVEERGRRP